MRFASVARSVCLCILIASPARASAAEPSKAPPEDPAAVPLLTAAAISGFLGTVALFIAFQHSDEDSRAISEDPFRIGMATTAGLCLGLGVVLVTAGVPALVSTPPNDQRSNAAPPARAWTLGYRIDF